MPLRAQRHRLSGYYWMVERWTNEYCCFCHSRLSADFEAAATDCDDVHLFTTADIVTALTTRVDSSLL